MKRLLIGLLVLVLLGIVSWMLLTTDNKSTIKGELTDFAIEDTASIDKIIMKDDAGMRAELVRQEEGWRLNDKFKARQDGINILLYTMKRVRVKSPVSQESMQSILKNIISSHVLVEAYDGNDLVKSYYVGGANQTHTGTNMLMTGSQRPFVMHIEGFHGYLTPRFFISENLWRHRGLFEYEADDIQTLSITYHENQSKNFKISRTEISSEAEITFGEGFQNLAPRIDTLMLNGYLSQYRKIHWESLEETKSANFIDSVKQSQPFITYNISTFSGDTKTVHGFKKPLPEGYDLEGNPTNVDIDRLYLWHEEEDVFVVGQYAIFDKLSKGITFFSRG